MYKKLKFMTLDLSLIQEIISIKTKRLSEVMNMHMHALLTWFKAYANYIRHTCNYTNLFQN